MNVTTRFLGVMIVVFAATSGQTQEKSLKIAALEALNLEYDIQRASLAKPIRDLQTSYQTQLETLRDSKQAAGNLEEALAVKQELEGFRGGNTEIAPQKFRELQRLQSIYVQEAQRRLKVANPKLPELVKVHKARLLELQTQLTQDGKLEEAAIVKAALENVDESLGIVLPGALERNPPSGPASVAWVGATKPLEAGELQFTNRGYVWKEVPRRFRGWQMAMHAGGSKASSKIGVKSRGLVYAIIDPADQKTFEKDGWKITETLIGGTGEQEYLLAEKPHEAGEYTLSGEGWFTTRVLVPPSPKE